MRVVRGMGGGESRMFHEWKEIEDHRHKNFVLPSHENKQVRYSVLTLEEVFKESKITNG